MRLNEQLPRAPFATLPARIALVSAHASPLAPSLAIPGSPAYAGPSLYVAKLAHELAGTRVDIFTRRDAPGQKQPVQLSERLRVIHVPAGPAHPLPAQQLLPHMRRTPCPAPCRSRPEGAHGRGRLAPRLAPPDLARRRPAPRERVCGVVDETRTGAASGISTL